MFLLLTRILLWAAVIAGIGYLISQIIPKPYVNYVGYGLIALLIVLTFYEPTNATALAASQLFSLPFKPLGIFIILLLNLLRIGLGADNARQQLVTIIVLMAVFSMSYFPRVFCQAIIERDAYALQQTSVNDPPGLPEAIVLLGWQSTNPHPISDRNARLDDKGDLILHTANLYLQGQAPRVIVSAGPRHDYTGPGKAPVEAQAISLLLQRLGVPRDSIFIENQGIDIRSSARNVSKLMEDFGLPKDIVLVSTAISAYRAMESFYEFGTIVAPRPAAYRTTQPSTGILLPKSGHEVIPTIEGLEFSTELTDEFFGSIYYFLRGWLSPGDLLSNRVRRAELPTAAPMLADAGAGAVAQ